MSPMINSESSINSAGSPFSCSCQWFNFLPYFALGSVPSPWGLLVFGAAQPCGASSFALLTTAGLDHELLI